jgi:outer membrane protein assembly factor BamB/tetratricopeptide (TPR) repeat protein
MLSLSGREGTLFIYEGSRKRALCFTKDGVSIRSRERNETNLIGKILVRLGKIEETELQRAIEKRRSSENLLGDVMVEMGLCAREDVELAFRAQCEEDIQDLFLNRNDAQFEYVDGFFPDADVPYVNLNVNALLIEIARRTDEWEYIRRRIRGPREIYRFTGVEGTVDADVLGECYHHRVDPFIDGTHSVGELIELSYVNRFEVCKLLAAYLDADVIELVPADAIRLNARMALRMGDLDTAIRHYEYLMSTGDFPLDVMGEAAEAHEATRDFSEAAALLRRLAEELVRSGDVRGAIDSLRRVANYPRPEPEALRYLLDLVFDNPRESAEFSAHVAEAGKTLVAYLIKHEQRREAIEMLDRLIRTFPDEISFAISLVNIHYEEGKIEKAAKECERLARDFIKRRKPTPAVSLYKKLLIIDPERTDIRERIRKLVSGKKRRSSAGAGARIAIALAVSLLVGGAAVVMLQKDGVIGPRTSDGDEAMLQQLLQRARDERGQAEVVSTNTIEKYRELAVALQGDLLPKTEMLLKLLEETEELYELFNKHAEATRSVADRIRSQTSSEEWRSHARALHGAVDDKESAVLHERRSWLASSQDAAEDLYDKGMPEYEGGELLVALERFALARRLATRRQWQVEVDLDRYINNIRGDVVRVNRQLETAAKLENEGQWRPARQIYFELLNEFGQADLIKEMRIPWEILTLPPDATVTVEGTEMTEKTPTIVRLSPFVATAVEVNKKSFVPKRYSLGPLRDAGDPDQFTYTWPLPRAATWSRDIGDHIESAPAAFGGRVAFEGRNGRWYVFEAESGKQIASAKLKTFGVSAGLATDGKLVFIPTLDGKLWALDGTAGKLLWHLKDFTGGIYATPVLADGRIYVADDSGHLSAHNLKTRKRVWKVAVPVGIRAQPVIQGDDIAVVSTAGEVTVLRRKDGKEVKRYKLKGSFSRAPALAGKGDLIFPTEEGILICVERVSGTERWRKDLGALIPSTPEVRGRVAFVAPRAGLLVAIDIQTGDEISRYLDSPAAARTPVAATGRMFFANGPVLSAFAAREGGYGLAWSFKAKGRILAGPVVAGDAVYIGDAEGTIYRLEAND